MHYMQSPWGFAIDFLNLFLSTEIVTNACCVSLQSFRDASPIHGGSVKLISTADELPCSHLICIGIRNWGRRFNDRVINVSLPFLHLSVNPKLYHALHIPSDTPRDAERMHGTDQEEWFQNHCIPTHWRWPFEVPNE